MTEDQANNPVKTLLKPQITKKNPTKWKNRNVMDMLKTTMLDRRRIPIDEETEATEEVEIVAIMGITKLICPQDCVPKITQNTMGRVDQTEVETKVEITARGKKLTKAGFNRTENLPLPWSQVRPEVLVLITSIHNIITRGEIQPAPGTTGEVTRHLQVTSVMSLAQLTGEETTETEETTVKAIAVAGLIITIAIAVISQTGEQIKPMLNLPTLKIPCHQDSKDLGSGMTKSITDIAVVIGINNTKINNIKTNKGEETDKISEIMRWTTLGSMITKRRKMMKK